MREEGYFRGIALARAGRLAEAESYFAEASRHSPDDSAVHFNRAVILALLKRNGAALESFERTLALRPNHVEAHFRRGILLGSLKRHGDALASFDRVIALQPAHYDAHYNRGLLLGQLGQHEEALASFQRVVALQPGHAAAHHRCGLELQRLDSLEAAVGCFDRAIALEPDIAARYADRAVALGHLGDYSRALQSLERALALDPRDPDAHNNSGNALRGLQRYEEAIASYEEALRLDPGKHLARWNLSLSRLLLGQFEEGWQLYEARFQVPSANARRRDDPARLWDGRAPAGKTILLNSEQGLGDTLQFCRYVTLLHDQGARVVLEVQPRLTALLRSLDGADAIVAEGEPAGEFDYHCPLLSLPLLCRTRLETIPAAVPYLRPEQARAAQWAQRLSGQRGRLRVGIAWQGNPDPEKSWARGRSVPLPCFRPLTDIPNVEFISLQKGHGMEQLAASGLAARITTPGEDFDAGPDAFLDAAAIIAELDLVITSDTSIAHLAGALGTPAWVALHANPDWRWLLDRSDSPWYPTMRLFRQQRPGDWAGVFEKIAGALGARASGSLI